MSIRNLAGLKKVLAVAVCALSGNAMALDLDTTFSTDGLAPVPGTETSSSVAVGMDGKIVLAGPVDVTTMRVSVARLNADGTVDTTFNADGNNDGFVVVDPCGTVAQEVYAPKFSEGKKLAVQPDGKILIAVECGDGTGAGNSGLVVRLTTAGALDNTFGTNGIVTLDDGPQNLGAWASAVALPGDGTIVVGGTYAPNEATQTGIATRLTEFGVVDTTFGTNGVTTFMSRSQISALRIDTNGSIALAGHRDTIVVPDMFVAVLQSSGIADGSFGAGGQATVNIREAASVPVTDILTDDRCYDVAFTDNGSVLCAGTYAPTGSPNYIPVVVQLNALGVVDTDFGYDGYYLPPVSDASDPARAYSLVVRADGDVIIGGENTITSQIFPNGVELDTLNAYHDIRSLALASGGSVMASIGMPASPAPTMLAARLVASTLSGDSTPNPFAFETITNVMYNVLLESDPITITGLTSPATISIANGEFSVGCDGTFVYGFDFSFVENGDTICVRHLTGNDVEVSSTTTITIGGVAGTFVAITGDGDADPFDIGSVTGVMAGSYGTSEPVTITGISIPTAISVVGSGEYSIGCGDDYTSEDGYIENGQTVCVRIETLSGVTSTTFTSLWVGLRSSTFSVGANPTGVTGGNGGSGGGSGNAGVPGTGAGWNGGVKSEGGWDWGSSQRSGGGGGSFDLLLLLGLLATFGLTQNHRRRLAKK